MLRSIDSEYKGAINAPFTYVCPAWATNAVDLRKL